MKGEEVYRICLSCFLVALLCSVVCNVYATRYLWVVILLLTINERLIQRSQSSSTSKLGGPLTNLFRVSHSELSRQFLF